MQGIGDKGDADWMSTDVGAIVGVFEVPTDMPTTAGGGRSPCQSVSYLISLIQLSCHFSFTVHVSIVGQNPCMYATCNTFTKDTIVEK